MAEESVLASIARGDEYSKISALPKNIKKRVCALKKLQLQAIDVEAKFYERVHALEIEFEELFKPVYEQRGQIIRGDKEPTDEEANAPLIAEVPQEVLDAIYAKSEPDTDAKGISDFWLGVLKNCETAREMIQEHDEPILSYLTDITSETLSDPPRFTIDFHFAKNPYFKNEVLHKVYFLQLTPSTDDEKIYYDGPNVIRVTGDAIEWEDGKNVTKKVVKKKAKKGANAGKFLTKTVKADSFFNFFDPPKSPDERNEEEEEDEGETELLQLDFELGQSLRDAVIPRAVLYYTGEVDNDDMLPFFGEDDDEDYSDIDN